MRNSVNKALGLTFFVILAVAPFWGQRIRAEKEPTESFQGREVAKNEVLVRFHPTTFQSVLQAQSAIEADISEWVGGVGILRLHSRGKGVATLIQELAARPDVAYVEPNYIVHTTAIPNDPSFGQLWGLQNTGQSILGSPGTAGADISAVSAWDVSTGSRSRVVAVVDTGVDYNHPDLAANIWSAPSAFTVTIAGKQVNCPVGSHGFNAITNVCDPLDDNDHGSHVSGTIGAVGNNGVGVVGVNWTANVMGAKFLNSSGSGTTANAINAIEFAIQAKAVFGGAGGTADVRVLSNSWGGGGFSQSLLDEINRANSNDMLFVAAAGNNSSDNDLIAFYPADYNAPNIIAVAATDNTDALAFFSNYGPGTVHLGAPGVDILSTTRNNTYQYFSGTSMATPHVSGSALLILSKCALSTASLKAQILNNVDPISSLAGLTITGGRLNVNKALRACATPTPDFSIVATPSSQTVLQGNSTTYTVNISPIAGFTGGVNLSVSGLPGGANGSFNPPSVAGGSGSSTLTVSTNASTPAGTSTLTITGDDGAGHVHSTTVTLVVTAPDFSLSATPTSQSVSRGHSVSYTVNITRTGGFAGSVTFSVSGLGNGATASFDPNPTSTTGNSSTMTVTTTSNASRGTFTLTIKGTSGSLSHSTNVTLRVTR